MATEPAAKTISPAKQETTTRKWARLIKAVEEMGWRAQSAVALQIAATCEEQLKERLLDAMVNSNADLRKRLFDYNGPWGNFAAKIDSCYALGLIESYHHKVLHVIRKVRNEFAHSHSEITFTSKSIVELMQTVPSVDKENMKENAETMYVVLAGDIEAYHREKLGYVPLPQVTPP